MEKVSIIPQYADTSPPAPTLLEFLQLLVHLNCGELFPLSSLRALRATSISVKTFIDAQMMSSYKFRCPGGQVPTFCSHTVWARNLQDVTLCALFGANSDFVDIRAFSALEMPELRRLEVQSLRLECASLLTAGNWPKLTNFSVRFRKPPRSLVCCNDREHCLTLFPAPSSPRWPVKELKIRFDLDYFSFVNELDSAAEATVAAVVIAAFPGAACLKLGSNMNVPALLRSLVWLCDGSSSSSSSVEAPLSVEQVLGSDIELELSPRYK